MKYIKLKMQTKVVLKNISIQIFQVTFESFSIFFYFSLPLIFVIQYFYGASLWNIILF